jgi:hypothetical protein
MGRKESLGLHAGVFFVCGVDFDCGTWVREGDFRNPGVWVGISVEWRLHFEGRATIEHAGDVGCLL